MCCLGDFKNRLNCFVSLVDASFFYQTTIAKLIELAQISTIMQCLLDTKHQRLSYSNSKLFMISVQDSKITAAGVLIISSDNLLVAFARGSDLTKLGLPCGKREAGETVIECAIRETLEEVGLFIELDGDEKMFVHQPDDKLSLNIEEYCATIVVRLEQSSSNIQLGQSNLSEDGKLEGVGVWIAPIDFVKAVNSAFVGYNTELLKFANLI